MLIIEIVDIYRQNTTFIFLFDKLFIAFIEVLEIVQRHLLFILSPTFLNVRNKVTD